ncbi:unnamed protein product, partial [Meganyctiphanes norvegica]
MLGHYSANNAFQCTVCDLKFTTNAAKKIHMGKHGKKKYLYCPVCLAQFKDPLKFRKHRLDLLCDSNIHPKKISKKITMCGICNRDFYRPVEREKHMQQTHGISDPRCFKCEYKAADMKDLQDHIRIHFPSIRKSKPCICTICGNRCNSNGMLIHHMKTHKAEKIACTECNFVGKNAISLRSHMLAHKNMNRYKNCSEENSYRTQQNSGAKDKDLGYGGFTILKLESGSDVTSPKMNMDVNTEAVAVKSEPNTFLDLECSYVAEGHKDLTRHMDDHMSNAMIEIKDEDIK